MHSLYSASLTSHGNDFSTGLRVFLARHDSVLVAGPFRKVRPKHVPAVKFEMVELAVRALIGTM